MPDHFKFTFNMIDQYGKTSAKTIELRDYEGITPDASLAQALSDAQALAEDFDQTTKAQIINVSVGMDLAGLFGGWTLKTSPISGADLTEVAEYALFPDQPAFPSQRLRFAIPSPVDALFVSPGVSRALNLGSALLGSLFSNFQSTPGGEPQISDGQNVDPNAGVYGNGVSSGKFVTRKSSTPRQI